MRQFTDKDIATTERITIQNGVAKPATSSGLNRDELVRVTFNDGTVLDLLRDEGWKDNHFTKANRLTRTYRGTKGLTEADLATAFVSTGNNPGLQLIPQSRRGEDFGGAICLTSNLEFVLWLDSKED